MEENLVEHKAKRRLPDKKRIGKIALYVLLAATCFGTIGGMILFENGTGGSSFVDVSDVLQQNVAFLVAAFLCFFVIIVCDTLIFFVLSEKIAGKRRVWSCLKTAVLGRCFDRITPWSVGGEPARILSLSKSGMVGSDACAVAMSRYIIRFFATVLFVTGIFLFAGVTTEPYVMAAAFFGLLIGLPVPIFLLVCAFRPHLGRTISSGSIRVLAWLKIVKNKEKAEENVQKKVTEFLFGVKLLSRNKPVILLIALGALAELFAAQSVPFLIMKALGVNEVSYWHTFVLCLYVNYAAGSVPTPGGSGAAEVSFYAIFDGFVQEGTLFWAVLLWRIAVFYLPVVIGLTLQLVLSVKEVVRKKRTRPPTR